MTIWLIYGLVGAVAGVLAGLLGVGGGIVIVPMLTYTFTAQHLPAPHLHHLALGTSMGTIVFTSIASFRAHHGKGVVNWPAVRQIAPGIVAGTLAGSWLAARLNSTFLRGFFILFTFYVALQLLLDIRPKPNRQLPGPAGLFGAGTLIGGVSSLVGIGGGSLSVPFLVWCNVTMYQAIGTSAAIGFPIAVAGALGYLVNGWGNADLPPYAAGFVYLPALVGIAAASYLTAPVGARLAHRLPVPKLKKVFAALLLLNGLKMLTALL
jgi:uncharacterized protein